MRTLGPGAPNHSADHPPGTFARVWLVRLTNAREADQNKVFALKILRKVDGMRASPRLSAAANGRVSVIRLKQVEHVRNERNVLAAVAGHPFITTMVASFQDHDSLYMLVCCGPFARTEGQLLTHRSLTTAPAARCSATFGERGASTNRRRNSTPRKSFSYWSFCTKERGWHTGI